jgi:hypothetical protein
MKRILLLLLACVFCEVQAQELPRISCWNTAQNLRPTLEDIGFDPNWQLEQIANGTPYLPSFEMFEGRFGSTDLRVSKPHYYQRLWTYAKSVKSPIVFVGDNWEDTFRLSFPWRAAFTDPTITDHPFIEKADGRRIGIVSPWGDNLHHWRDFGNKIGTFLKINFADDYPDCPEIVLFNNCEVGFSKKGEHREDINFPPHLLTADDLTIELQAYNNYKIRRMEFRAGLEEACPQWAGRIRYLAYGGWGNEFMIGEANSEEQKRQRYAFPWGYKQLGWGAAINAGYIHSWQTYEPDNMRAPVIQATNARYALDKYRQYIDPTFDASTIYWNGKKDNTDVWRGSLTATMWVMRTDIHQLFVSSAAKKADFEERDMRPLIEAVTEVHTNPTLTRFWKHGKLLENHWRRDFNEIPKLHENDNEEGYGHPYWYERSAYPEWKSPTERFWIQHVPINKRLIPNTYGNRMFDSWRWNRSRTTEVKVWAICFEHEGEYLLHAHAPKGQSLTNVEIRVCPDEGDPRFIITVNVPVAGGFWLRDKNGGLTQIAGEVVPDPLPIPVEEEQGVIEQ